MEPTDVLRFWFEELEQGCWWTGSDELDATIRERFGAVHRAAAAGELESWRASPEGRLAEILVLDQFSRNLHRDSAEAFAADATALVLAQEAIRSGDAALLPPERRAFVYMPFMHSESAVVHERALELFAEEGMAQNLDFERKHKAIIDRFGRYPHRNAVLGRSSTPDEIEFLKSPGSSFQSDRHRKRGSTHPPDDAT